MIQDYSILSSIEIKRYIHMQACNNLIEYNCTVNDAWHWQGATCLCTWRYREKDHFCALYAYTVTHAHFMHVHNTCMYSQLPSLPTHTHIMQVWVYMHRHTHSPKYVNSLVRKGNPTKSYTTQHMWTNTHPNDRLIAKGIQLSKQFKQRLNLKLSLVSVITTGH